MNRSSSQWLAHNAAMREKVLGLGIFPVRPPEPTKCPHCDYPSAAIVCPLCKRPK